MTSHIHRQYGWHGARMGRLYVPTLYPVILIFFLNEDSTHTRIQF